MPDDIVRLAIEAALQRNWEKAIEINRTILKEKATDAEALNRLAFALTERGNIKEARAIYNKVLSINRFNPIALKNLKRLALLRGEKIKPTTTTANTQTNHTNTFSGLFLEEVGKTKVVALINLAEAKILSRLHPTNPVILIPRRRGVSVTTADDIYIGALPDDIARRLYVLITGGNQYEAYIKSVDRNEISIFIRETMRQRKFRNQPSFLGKGTNYYPFVREDVLVDKDKPDVSRLEDLDEDESDSGSDDREEDVS